MQTKIRYKPAANGFETIYLDTCFHGKRKYEMLRFKVKCKPQTREERRYRREKEGGSKSES